MPPVLAKKFMKHCEQQPYPIAERREHSHGPARKQDPATRQALGAQSISDTDLPAEEDRLGQWKDSGYTFCLYRGP